MRCAIVTGGGTGIGAATARALARDGHAVVLAGRRTGPLEAVAAEIGAACEVVGADVATPDGARAVAAAATARFGRADVLVNNAGVGDSGALLDESPEEWESTLRINLTGAFLVTQAVLPALLERGGAVVNVSSINGLLAGPGWTSYVNGAALLVDGGTAVVDPTAEALG